MGRQMVPDDDRTGYGKTSLTMTRAMSDDIGMKLKKIMELIHNTIDPNPNDMEKIGLTHAQWQEVVSYLWNDEIWSDAINKAVIRCKQADINLNSNMEFLILILEKGPIQLKAEFRKTHPIARLALMDLVTKEPPEPEKKRKYADLWKSPDELKKEYKK